MSPEAEELWDAIVIGSGAAGLAAFVALTEGGKKVLGSKGGIELVDEYLQTKNLAILGQVGFMDPLLSTILCSSWPSRTNLFSR